MNIEEMKARKQALGLTNQDIATLTGVPLGTVQKVFAGITASPRYSTILALEKILGEDNVLMQNSPVPLSQEGPVRDRIRKDIKQELASYAKLLDEKGLVNTMEGNLSVYDRANDLLYITPSGTRKSFLDDGKIAVLHGDEQIDGSLERSSEYLLHLAALKSRPDVNAVAHLHAPYLTAYAFCGKSVKIKCSTTFTLLFEEIPCLPYGMPGTPRIADGIEEAIAAHDLILLQNHGVVAVGPDLEYAVSLVEAAEEVLKTYSLARQIGEVADLDPAELEELAERHPSSRRNRMRRVNFYKYNW